MATSRYIKTTFWDDSWVRGQTPTERYVYLYLLTNPLTNIAGIYEITTDRIQFDTALRKQDVKRILDSFRESGKAIHHDERWMILPNWPKHQEINSGLTRKGLERILAGTPPEVIEIAAKYQYKYEGLAAFTRRGIEGVSETEEGASSGIEEKVHPSRYSTLLYAGGGGPVPPAASGVENLFRDFSSIVEMKGGRNVETKK